MKLLEGKMVLVAGASTGIGRAAAIGTAQHGANVVINYRSRDADANACIAAFESTGQRRLAVKGDVAEAATATDFVAKAVAAFGRVDVMASNADICPFHSVVEMPDEALERTLRVNLHGAYDMCQAPARRMVKQGHGGAILAIASISALVGGEYQTHYTPTEAGVHSPQ